MISQKQITEPILKVLLVDDSQMVFKHIKKILTPQKNIVLEYCGNSTEALETVINFKPNVILQDYIMPNRDGFDLLKEYRKTASIFNIPVLMLSAVTDTEIKAKAFALGANDYLAKDSHHDEFIARILYHGKRHIALTQSSELSKSVLAPAKHTIKVLMIDNSKFACRLVEDTLKKEKNIEFRSCIGEEKVIETALDFQPTVILQSLKLNLIKKIRQEQQLFEVPIIVFSGKEDVKTKAQAFSAGANDYIVKSYDFVDLVSRITVHSNEYFNIRKLGLSTNIKNIEATQVRAFMIDDSETYCLNLIRQLNSEKNVLFSYCTDPHLAPEKAKQFSPSIILMDLQMPQMDGFELLSEFKRHPELEAVPVVMLSGSNKPTYKAKSFALGACDYMEKGMGFVA